MMDSPDGFFLTREKEDSWVSPSGMALALGARMMQVRFLLPRPDSSQNGKGAPN